MITHLAHRAPSLAECLLQLLGGNCGIAGFAVLCGILRYFAVFRAWRAFRSLAGVELQTPGLLLIKAAWPFGKVVAVRTKYDFQRP